MEREIYEVYAKVVDANGTYNTLSGYPKVFDSKNYNNDTGKARSRAYAEYYSVLSTMYTRDDRQLQLAMILFANNGMQLEMSVIGEVADLPDTSEE